MKISKLSAESEINKMLINPEALEALNYEGENRPWDQI